MYDGIVSIVCGIGIILIARKMQTVKAEPDIDIPAVLGLTGIILICYYADPFDMLFMR